jgi:exodeoxyribonuclease VII large subunit
MMAFLEDTKQRCANAVFTRIAADKTRLQRYSERKVFEGPEELLAYRGQMVDHLQQRLQKAGPLALSKSTTHFTHQQSRFIAVRPRLLMQQKLQVEKNAARLDALSPLKVLSRGYAFVQDTSSHQVIDSVEKARVGQSVDLRLGDGILRSEINSVIRDDKHDDKGEN